MNHIDRTASSEDCGCTALKDKVDFSADKSDEANFVQRVAQLGGKASHIAGQVGRFMGGAVAGEVVGSLGIGAGFLLGGLYLGTVVGPLSNLTTGSGDRTPLLASKEDYLAAKREREELECQKKSNPFIPFSAHLMEDGVSFGRDIAWEMSSPVRWAAELGQAGMEKGWNLFNQPQG